MRLERSFFVRDVLEVAPDLIGKRLVRQYTSETRSWIITEVEAYKGMEDQASHARFGKTSRNSIMFEQGGFVYMYLIYGMYWMLNVVTGARDNPQAVLLRGLNGIDGPGRVTKVLQTDRSFYGEDLTGSTRIWIEEGFIRPDINCTPRIGINYAGEPWKSNPWRFILVQQPQSV